MARASLVRAPTLSEPPPTPHRFLLPGVPAPGSCTHHHCLHRQERLIDLFKDIDKDGSGGITLDELMGGLTRRGLRYSRKQKLLLMKLLDSDGDGAIDYEEFTFARKMLSQSGSDTVATAVHTTHNTRAGAGLGAGFVCKPLRLILHRNPPPVTCLCATESQRSPWPAVPEPPPTL